jgi:hypothetical protein
MAAAPRDGLLARSGSALEQGKWPRSSGGSRRCAIPQRALAARAFRCRKVILQEALQP